MALLAHACSVLIVWAAIKTAVCLKSSCLIASSSPADKISFTECTNEALNFTWSLDIQRYDLEIVKFEYSCINASNVAILQNQSILYNDGPQGSAAFTRPVPGAICLVSACYTDSARSLHYISPTGCSLMPSTAQGDATPIKIVTSDFAYMSSFRTSDPLISTSHPVPVKGVNDSSFVGVTIGVVAFAVISVCALALLLITCLARAVKTKIYQRELKQIGSDATQEIDQNYSPVGVQISPAHVTHAVSSEFSVLDDLEWLPPCGVDSDITKVCGDFLGTNDPEVLVAHTNVVDACMTASIQEQHSSAFSGHKMNNESIETVHSEAGSGLGHELRNTRPADILASNWLCGKPAAFDLTVVSPLNPTFISEAGRTAGSAAIAAELRKHSANDAKCSELGWTCIPLVAESYGTWGSEAVQAFSRLASYLATRTNSPKSCTAALI
ncbi:hypothetical protein EMCRGX_G023219 [Ephydatia muelleri]